MRSWMIFAVALAVASVALFPQLPPLRWPLCALAVALCVYHRWALPITALTLALSLGLCWGVAYGHWRVASLLPVAAETDDWQVRGRIVDLPSVERIRGQAVQRFVLQVEHIDDWPMPHQPQRVRLTWYGGPDIRSGQRWDLRLRLKRPRGSRNPGLFDYGSWLVASGFDATGYVRRADSNQRVGHDESAGIAGLRERLSRQLAQTLGPRPGLAPLQALLVADRRGMTDDDWSMFTRTGTIHLMVISGLHIGLLAGGVYWVGRRVLGPALPYRLRHLVPLLALGAAWGYALLAGFAVPVRRAALMFSVLVLAVSWRREVSGWRALLWALLAVLLADPLAPTSRGSWLSFLAVALILWVLDGRRNGRGTFLRVQLALMLGLMPWLAWFGAAQGLVALPANLVAVPVVSLLVVPGLAVGLVFPSVWALSATLMEWLLLYLGWLDGLGVWQRMAPAPEALVLGVSALACFWWLAPRALPGRWLLVPVIALVLLPARAYRPGAGLDLYQLDVGQGTAILVQVAERSLLYDAGPATPGGFDTGAAIVLPYLQRMGLTKLDMLTLSHSDLDHTGGAAAVIEGMTIDQLRWGEALPKWQGEACRAGEGWRWGDAHFQWLYPTGPGLKNNAASCVLAIDYGGRRILLTGDIGKAEERAILSGANAALRADVVSVPHHGSRHSSSLPFVARTEATLALVSAGYRNPFGHPHPSVIQRWEAYGAVVLTSAEQGAIHIHIAPDGVISWRGARERRHYWD